ncbi:DUF3160 domain-containing protein [Chloroflexota bacterium]
MQKFVTIFVLLAILFSTLPSTAQDATCANPPPRLTVERHGLVTPGTPVSVRAEPSTSEEQLVGQIEAGTLFEVTEGPVCAEGINWWHINSMEFWGSWIAEGADGQYFVEPYHYVPAPPAPLNVPLTPPIISDLTVPLPAVEPTGNPAAIASTFAPWNWEMFAGGSYYNPPDPLALQLPATYAGDFPELPVDLSTVHFVLDAGLNDNQLALLAQNGFVAVPGGYPQFDEVYGDGTWTHQEGKGDFITTDALLHSLFITYQNALMFLEQSAFYGNVANFVGAGYQQAEQQWRKVIGTPLEAEARSAALFYAVPLLLLVDGEAHFMDPLLNTTRFTEDDLIPSEVVAAADPDLMAEAAGITALAYLAEGREPVPFLADLEEDFSQYKPRGYYEGDPLLEAYFRAMMWLGRITFKTDNASDTRVGLLALRALMQSGRYEDWQDMAATLDFLIGPMDDFSPADYGPLVEQAFGAEFSLEALADDAKLADFLASTAQLPGPRVNSIPLPVGITAEAVDAATRGFRLFGQRFTLDGYMMQQLIYPEVGEGDHSRTLPMALDVAAALGSDMAFTLTDEAGATSYVNYTGNMADLRGEVNALTADDYLENIYGGWLWALGPLLVRNEALEPPLMQTDAWRRKDINTTLGSWTELKHATLLYAEQPYGGLGGGGMLPPVISTSIVEPNPLAFARIAVVAATLSQGLTDRDLIAPQSPMDSVRTALGNLAKLSAYMAEMARKEIAGEPLTYDELYFLQENFDGVLWGIRYNIEQWLPDPPETVALVADVASNPAANTVLEEAIGDVDLIYVIGNGEHGLHLTRGAVYSTYEFTQPIDERLTDDEWREMVAAGEAPARPTWIDLYFSE